MQKIKMYCAITNDSKYKIPLYNFHCLINGEDGEANAVYCKKKDVEKVVKIARQLGTIKRGDARIVPCELIIKDKINANNQSFKRRNNRPTEKARL